MRVNDVISHLPSNNDEELQSLKRQLYVKYSPIPHNNLLLMHDLPRMRYIVKLPLGVEGQLHMQINRPPPLVHILSMQYTHSL